MKEDKQVMEPGSGFTAGVSGNARQRRLMVRRWRASGRIVRFCMHWPGRKQFRVGVPENKDKVEWIRRCAARFAHRGGLSQNEAYGYAQVTLDAIGGDLTETPEDAADDDMACWTD